MDSVQFFLSFKFLKIFQVQDFLQQLQVWNCIWHTPVMSCYKEAYGLWKILQVDGTNFTEEKKFCLESSETDSVRFSLAQDFLQ